MRHLKVHAHESELGLEAERKPECAGTEVGGIRASSWCWELCHYVLLGYSICPGNLFPSDFDAISGRMRAKKRPPIFEASMDTNPPLRSSGRQVKKKTFETEEEEEGSEKKYRKCEKAGCSATYPVCFASAAERCAKNGYTSRWYHLSCGEHFCNECFDHCYRSHKDGYEKYATWKRIWTSNGKSEPSLKAFMADQLVPYWVQCTKPDCAKWRQLTRDVQMTTASAKTYRCGMKTHTAVKSENSDPCSLSEDMRVSEVGDSKWYSMLIVPPLLKDSPAAPFLGAYYPDCVGMSPSCSNTNRFHNEFSNMKMISSEHSRKNVQSPVAGMSPYFQPFYQPNECGKALCVRPDVMELDELYEFPEYSRDPTMYLALRNLILALWHINCKEVLTPQKCANHIVVRGLVRIRCVLEVEKILYFVTRKGLVNTGVLAVNPDHPLLPSYYHKKHVIVIGAGAAGLAAARQLQNFGIKLGSKMHKLGDRCDLIEEGGRVVDPTIDKCIDFHFNAMLDVVAEWRKDKKQFQDVPLGEKIEEIYQTFIQESGVQFSELEAKVLQFHLGNLEYACGSNLQQVSARSWDHNEFFAQFAGDHTLFISGYSAIINKLGDGLDIRLNTPVQTINFSGDDICIGTTNGMLWTTQKVLITVPLALLQKNTIQFYPALSERKLKAINSLGQGVIEKIALQFPYKFWEKKIQGADFFGHIPPSSNKRGLFGVFYDMDPQGEHCVLMSVISGDAVAVIQDMQEQQVAELCMSVLRELFKEGEVPDPVRYFVTHWSKDPWAQMAYSFIKAGGSGEAYDIIAEDIQGKVFFAGEATNRHFPQTVTGAYLSGVREASKIATL
ncbi:lysine-specific histone demethylase 2 isoform X4 [Stegostoma tigrinum]|uniref:lysine-specific histone demethylase 2 isoform X4 n=1 Tax=Stegostoma tigrinum TaxID=3053191 RepID=UPI00202B5688|nr:lysine-specific histone demethylase 2 isoform X4 [Stegostoma tigrinum]